MRENVWVYSGTFSTGQTPFLPPSKQQLGFEAVKQNKHTEQITENQ